MFFVVVILLVVCIGLPLFYAWRIWRLDEPSILGWLLVVVDACVFVALIILVGRWDIAGYYLQFVLLAVLAVSILASLIVHVRRPFAPSDRRAFFRQRIPTVVSLAAFGAAIVYVVSGTVPPNQARDLAFPLRDGRFVVGQGGGVTLLNKHASHDAQRFAADITAIGQAGFRASGILPDDLDRYEIFGKPVVSPCAGSVTRVVTGLPDLTPPNADPDNLAGNLVVLLCDGLQVELAHLQEGSVSVEAGQQVSAGDPIGRVGNSGNTTEPHLHIHAVDPETNAGVPITFDGRFPFRNSVF
ncbi:M23 family metallopeptidase [Mesorhizobium australicum]|uniref:Peptidase family M23 n=1 Tax=Mesorhizobium australicum TaxID=536018 RepID=A0A1X7MYX2_9HYPH|nr:M23 family metallopeptidase [Mesorhizobium australicum]SMH30038.1 Peptidase family M23 [Mesorhizobium australicum]